MQEQADSNIRNSVNQGGIRRFKKVNTNSVRFKTNYGEETNSMKIEIADLVRERDSRTANLPHKANRKRSKSKKRRHNQSCDSMREILSQIQPRGAAFFRLGFNSLEKGQKQKKIFSDFFNLRNLDMKGSMSTADLWSNKQRSNFLKQNKIHLNKVKLLEKISNFKKQENRQMKGSGQSSSYINTLNSLMNFESISHMATFRNLVNSSRTEISSQNKNNMIKAIDVMRKDLAELQKTTGEDRGMVKEMQNESEGWQKMGRKYFQKLIEMV